LTNNNNVNRFFAVKKMKVQFIYDGGRRMSSLPIDFIRKSKEIKCIPLLSSILLFFVTSLFIQMLWSQHSWLNKLEHYHQGKSSVAVQLKHWQPIADHFYEHHSQLKTHQFQMDLGSLLKPELHEIMSKQYDIPHGLYNGKPYKKILYWNNAGTFPITRENSNFGLGVGRDRYEKAGCPVWQCETSEDRTNLLQYDVIIFNQHRWNWSDLPEKRSPHQLYIFFSYEPPTLFRLIGNWDQIWDSMKGPFFNWTMTYRWDSDIVNPYGWIEPINPTVVPIHPDAALYSQLIEESHIKDAEVNYAAGKTKMAIFFQTSCHDRFSNRNELINKLKESGVDIDLYGACHELQCAFNKFSLYREEEEHELCMEMAAKKYKFYLAFHNSLCLDYTPERYQVFNLNLKILHFELGNYFQFF